MSRRNYLNGTLASARRIMGVHVGHSVTKFNRCVGQQLSGTRPGNQPAVRAAFTAAAKGCRGQ